MVRVARLAAVLLLVPLLLLLSLPAAAQDHSLVVNHTGDGGSVDSVDDPDEGDCAEAGSLVCAAGVAGDCSLRQAIQCANLWGDLDPPQSSLITFENMPIGGEIVPQSPLPPLTARGTELDGFECDPCGITADASILEGELTRPAEEIISALDPGPTISGASLTDGIALLEIQGQNITVSGLILVRGSGPGIQFKPRAGSGPPAESSVVGCFIGTNPEGDSGLGNLKGVVVSNGSELEIRHNLISGNGVGLLPSGSTPGGIDLSGGQDSKVYSNLIGTDASGTNAVPNGGPGVRIRPLLPGGTVTGAVIGGESSHEGNLIGGNQNYGVSITGDVTNTNVRNNRIGTLPSGGSPNGGSGVRLAGRSGAGRLAGAACGHPHRRECDRRQPGVRHLDQWSRGGGGDR